MPSQPTGLTDQGFKLYYEDFDRMGTAGVSTQLHSTNIHDAVKEARSFLKRMKRLPEQTHVQIERGFLLDVSDMSLGPTDV